MYLQTSGFGLLVLESNTSEMVSLFEGGKGTPEKKYKNYESKQILKITFDIVPGKVTPTT